MKTSRGFTLIELLVAIGIMAIVAVLGWRGLDSIVRARVALNTELNYTRGLQLTFAQMQSDASHIATRNSVGNRDLLQADPGRLALVRFVFTENQPSRLQVVTYRLRDGVLTRQESVATRDLRQLDQAWTAAVTDADTSQGVVLDNAIVSMTIRGWSAQNSAWQPNPHMTLTNNAATQAAQAAGVPETAVTPNLFTGLEVSLRTNGSEASLVKVFLLGAA